MNIVRRLADGADLRRPVSAQVLRATGAMMAYEAGVSVEEICIDGRWATAALARLVFRHAGPYTHPMTGVRL